MNLTLINLYMLLKVNISKNQTCQRIKAYTVDEFLINLNI